MTGVDGLSSHENTELSSKIMATICIPTDNEQSLFLQLLVSIRHCHLFRFE